MYLYIDIDAQNGLKELIFFSCYVLRKLKPLNLLQCTFERESPCSIVAIFLKISYRLGQLLEIIS